MASLKVVLRLGLNLRFPVYQANLTTTSPRPVGKNPWKKFRFPFILCFLLRLANGQAKMKFAFFLSVRFQSFFFAFFQFIELQYLQFSSDFLYVIRLFKTLPALPIWRQYLAFSFSQPVLLSLLFIDFVHLGPRVWGKLFLLFHFFFMGLRDIFLRFFIYFLLLLYIHCSFYLSLSPPFFSLPPSFIPLLFSLPLPFSFSHSLLFLNCSFLFFLSLSNSLPSFSWLLLSSSLYCSFPFPSISLIEHKTFFPRQQ